MKTTKQNLDETKFIQASGDTVNFAGELKLKNVTVLLPANYTASTITINNAISQPDNVYFTTAPGTPEISVSTGGTVTLNETEAEISVSGTTTAISAQTLTFNLAASGKTRIDLITLNYSTFLYERIEGLPVDENLTAPSPSLPDGNLFVRFLTVGDGTVNQSDTDLTNYYTKSEINTLLESRIFEYTYSELRSMASGGSLIQGNFYLMKDFQTIHQIPYTTSADTGYINSGVTESLILLAVTKNHFSNDVKSPSYPNDIIYYDINDNICEDGVTPRKGKILYRKDTSKSIECYYDWRNVKFRRWAITANKGTWDSTSGYANNDSVIYNGQIYSAFKANTGNTPNVINSGSCWCHIATDKALLAYTQTGMKVGARNVNVDTTLYKDFYTFHNHTNNTEASLSNTKMKNIYTGKGSGSATQYYNNVIFNVSSTNDLYNIHFRAPSDCYFNNNTMDSISDGTVFTRVISMNRHNLTKYGKAAADVLFSQKREWMNYHDEIYNCVFNGGIQDCSTHQDFGYNIILGGFFQGSYYNTIDCQFLGRFSNNLIINQLTEATFTQYILNSTIVSANYMDVALRLDGYLITGNSRNIDTKSPNGTAFYRSATDEGTIVLEPVPKR